MTTRKPEHPRSGDSTKGGIPLPASRRIRNFRSNILKWSEFNGRTFPWRQPEASLYLRVVTEVLLQQTRAESVARFLPEFQSAFPRWSAIASAELERLEQMLRPLGLWRRRASGLKRLAISIVSLREVWPDQRECLERLPAVGQYVASAVLLFAHGLPEPLLDVNMARVIERYFGPRQLADIRYDPYLQRIARRVTNHSQSKEVSWAILDLGAAVCTAKKPRCHDCPLRRRCLYFQRGR